MKIPANKLRFVLLVLAVGLGIVGLSLNHQTLSPDSRAETEPNVQNVLQWNEFDEGMAKASQENKLILVDVYTDWCHWCKEMDEKVYTDDTVIDIIKEHYVPIKLNAESSEKISYNNKKITMQAWSSDIGVTGYPTTIFFEPNGTPITLLPGYVDVSLFIDILEYVSSNAIKDGITFDDWQKNKNGE